MSFFDDYLKALLQAQCFYQDAQYHAFLAAPWALLRWLAADALTMPICPRSGRLASEMRLVAYENGTLGGLGDRSEEPSQMFHPARFNVFPVTLVALPKVRVHQVGQWCEGLHYEDNKVLFAVHPQSVDHYEAVLNDGEVVGECDALAFSSFRTVLLAIPAALLSKDLTSAESSICHYDEFTKNELTADDPTENEFHYRTVKLSLYNSAAKRPEKKSVKFS